MSGRLMSGTQLMMGVVPHWLATQVRCRHGSDGGGQLVLTVAGLQQPATLVLPVKLHWLSVQVATWHELGLQSVFVEAVAQQRVPFDELPDVP
jgi:hypothetical protein